MAEKYTFKDKDRYTEMREIKEKIKREKLINCLEWDIIAIAIIIIFVMLAPLVVKILKI